MIIITVNKYDPNGRGGGTPLGHLGINHIKWYMAFQGFWS